MRLNIDWSRNLTCKEVAILTCCIVLGTSGSIFTIDRVSIRKLEQVSRNEITLRDQARVQLYNGIYNNCIAIKKIKSNARLDCNYLKYELSFAQKALDRQLKNPQPD